ncbi:MAG: alpha/beta hydrolase [Sandaracinaceae bacterium]|nr:alpha/beta hydrolase [Sandaracinaceae bacterium]
MRSYGFRIGTGFVVLAALTSLAFGPGSVRMRARAVQHCVAPPPRHAAHVQRMRFAGSGRSALALDLMVPAGPGPHPLVVLVHGGAWRRGRRGYMSSTMRAFAAQGYAAATVDYRLVDGHRTVFPGPVSDVRCAVRTLRARAGELGLDPHRFAAVGFSAGGHLVAMLGTASDRSELDDGTCPIREGSAAVQSVASFYGPYDLRPPARVGPGADQAIRALLGVSRQRDPLRAALASPIAHVDSSDPPMLLVHGVRDRIVEVDQSRQMGRALAAAGVRVESLELPRHQHGFGVFPRRVTDDEQVACSTLSFLRETLPHR